MNGLGKLTLTEAKLFLRDKVSPLFALVLPVFLLLAIGLQFRDGGAPGPDPDGLKAAYFVASIALALALATLSFNSLPTYLATYREKGVLRRLQATPAHPAMVLVAQIAVGAGTALVSTSVIVVAGHLALDIPLPASVLQFAAALALSIAALFSLGLVVAALAPTARASTAAGMVLFFPSMFLAGVWTPKETMPSWLAAISDYTPLGAALQTLRDTWSGAGLQPHFVLVLAVTAAVLGSVAAALFRWE
ncbi:ABC transporter permease [Allokutzneria albata]|uniref:Transport permease protein n=1 Tax=Allokutzneria albata TaxID=211114 RepID=A0A1H0B5P2_ALLAB|nr:ABC transporter permease [Allokutzneria albata]SDN41048.1 ABC-2 type transport system permease protein [Allokutzneria albata]